MGDDDWKWDAPLCDVDEQADRVPELLAELRRLRAENELLRVKLREACGDEALDELEAALREYDDNG